MKMNVKAVAVAVATLGLVWSASGNCQPRGWVQPDIQAEALAAHNKWRHEHHAPNLTWDPKLQQYAEKYAKQCIFKHSNPPYGENLASGYPTITAAVNAWYSEEKLYSYRHSTYVPAAGHFTQLIWADTKRLGCAVVACNGENGTPGKYLVCEYDPPGNITNPGFFQKNVIPKEAGWY